MRSLVVDLPNLRAEWDEEVYQGDTKRKPLRFADIVDIMRDLEALVLGIPIFYVIDAPVRPHGMTAQEEARLRRMESISPREPQRIWRMKWKRDKEKQTADIAICELVNKCKSVALTEDHFTKESRKRQLHRPHELIRFKARRDTRDQPFQFENEGRIYQTADLKSLAASLSNVEYWEEWRKCASELARHMERDQKRSDERSIKTQMKRVLAEPISDMPDLEISPDASIEPQAVEPSLWPIKIVKNRHKSLHFEDQRDRIAIEQEQAEEWIASTHVETEVHQPAQEKRPSQTATFAFTSAIVLRRFKDQQVGVVGRAYLSGDGLELRYVASGLRLRVEVNGNVDMEDAGHFAKASGFLTFDGRDWVLRDAQWEGRVTTVEFQRLSELPQSDDSPTYMDWGRLPNRVLQIIRNRRVPEVSQPTPVPKSPPTPVVPKPRAPEPTKPAVFIPPVKKTPDAPLVPGPATNPHAPIPPKPPVIVHPRPEKPPVPDRPKTPVPGPSPEAKIADDPVIDQDQPKRSALLLFLAGVMIIAGVLFRILM